ncbi:MAG: alpha/beta hydrolase [Deltaproteobacteria bacterium]|nr:alpha/beta hydrolase [Deltaproteobacteria bacterium]MDQ3297094.1 hypothetical protein [Myxococcota bacterium]
MNRSVVALLALSWLVSSDVRAEESLPLAEPAIDEAGTPGENELAPIHPADSIPDPEPAPTTTAPATSVPRARLSTQRPPRPRVRDNGTGRLEKEENTVLGGRHFRIKTAQGAVHVWVPPDYDRETAGTVVYVHGYWTDADGAWKNHELAKQFRASRQNAMFIVPDAPSSNEESVRWPALTDLRRAVTRANVKLPDGPIVVIGHSGAFRTVMQWVDHRGVDQIILLDAMYAGERAFDEFIASGKRADHHKLIVVAASTADSSASFAKKYKFAVAREKMPDGIWDFTKRERGAKLLYIRSQYGHMQIVTSRKVIPTLLRVTPLKAF